MAMLKGTKGLLLGSLAAIVVLASVAPAANVLRPNLPVLVQCWHVEDGDWSSDTTCHRSPWPVARAAERDRAARTDQVAPPQATPEPSEARRIDSTAAPWIEEDFASYDTSEDLLRYPNPMWSGPNEDVNPRSILLDPEGPPVGGKSMRYAFRDRSGRRNVCRDYTIGRNVEFPETVREVWFEAWFKFSPGWETRVPSCDGTSSNGYKFLFGRVRPDGRFAVIIGAQRSHSYTIEYPGGRALEMGRGPARIQWNDLTNGQWHLLQQHLRVSSTRGAADGYMETRIDGVLLRRVQNVVIDRRGVYGMALGRNLNQGPNREQSLWWGRIRAWRTNPGWTF